MEKLIEIRKISSIEELTAVQTLDQTIWKTEAIPVHQTLTVVQNGGLMIGAFDNGRLVGFSYSFPGLTKGKVYLCSHMLGIHPDYRGQGIGVMLKKAQKNEAKEIGYTLMTWTYDPLESVNAFLNLSKLKGVANTYIENCYGEMNDGLNDGLPTDRLKVQWHIQQQPTIRICTEANQETYKSIANWKINHDGLPVINRSDLTTVKKEHTILVPIPKAFQCLKQTDFQLALDWRLQTREFFQTAFQAKFTAVHVLKTEDPVYYYVLTKQIELPAL
ncbi:GNAT family N-acetyltransferase [Bacillus chungangensis]|uniref:GNAT superfamily acetyltransferase n=1 Tax=Bacillus chungangensis TaxID=587633 RepID=A0ABT9WW06_9BACI|nr:GNAT family N-acetyltransferase [Bacillus chungangensis]MDQ0177361.1 putative GNAT superfamily acetyltransferase [Bacillus chungangensis]